MIKFSHSVFALPFALTSATWAGLQYGISFKQIFWILVAMVTARSSAMGFNRLADKELDAKNPRTQKREIPTGKLSVKEVWIFVIFSSALFILASWSLNRLCFYLSPVALFTIFFYSYTKRFTWLSHAFLGFSHMTAIVGSWLAVAGEFALPPILLGISALLWMVGFDTVYACQDYEFDKKNSLYSIPQTFGIENAMIIARISHLFSFSILISLKFILNLGIFYSIGLVLVGIILVYQHIMVSKAVTVAKVNTAFFMINGILSSIYFIFTLLDTL
jgi:4-hydroxybenzoate polyprenyltransferase